ncbi:MAG TPA: hydantoinase/oxoprolinase family protein [Alphaproteobacteria bacterium]|nr:hydantoinase/oxoprolinase family protein [Alphaproteobacteria bacterium]
MDKREPSASGARNGAEKSSAPNGVRIGVDIGGTFTDVVLEVGGAQHTAKVLTTHDAPDRAVIEGLARAREASGVAPGDVEIIIHGTTLATNAIIERKGAKTALITTEGFRDVIEMGSESRFDQYDLKIEKPAPLAPRRLRFGIAERLSVAGDVLVPLDEAALAKLGRKLKTLGVESAAIGFLHSYQNPAHERRAAEILGAAYPGLMISLSSEVSAEMREYERFTTACANAYVRPLIARYLDRLEAALQDNGFACPLFLMLSSGGVTRPETAKAFPVRLVESGPAGGAILAAHIAREAGLGAVLSFDMGGTTAKICLIDDGIPQPARAFEVARAYRFKPGSGLPLRIPVIEMVEIGAGGGSIARVDAMKRITVGPDSAGSEPGPACYDRGGREPTVTDADVMLGRIGADGFAGGAYTLDPKKAEAALKARIGTPLGLDAETAAWGVAEMVDENMSNAAREHGTERGKDVAGRVLIAFGGSAPVHATRIADKLGIDRILVPVAAGVGSAVGFLRAPVAYELARTAYQRLDSFAPALVNPILAAMSAEAARVVALGAPGRASTETRHAYMRYLGQGHEIPVAVPARALGPQDGAGLRAAYEAAYNAKYGRLVDGVDVEVVSWIVTISAAIGAPAAIAMPAHGTAKAVGSRLLFDPETGDSVAVAVYERDALPVGAALEGPAVIAEKQTTTVVPAHFSAHIDAAGNIVLDRKATREEKRA